MIFLPIEMYGLSRLTAAVLRKMVEKGVTMNPVPKKSGS
jgi:hypothetical protein